MMRRGGEEAKRRGDDEARRRGGEAFNGMEWLVKLWGEQWHFVMSI
jgi:hypothetical protein